ncbi:Protein-serine/threonine kinases Rhodoplastic [Chondrus crispus]|uniref:Protein-serine/threonine kinases Rhodoplastic n=1 Tax=Chondrus crispus TaxID=2769 RepID=R7QFT1_CHOCR|nr:Protein-serine/threonine kinases Rhodoplastic [Chondrus crispus]CDF37382.1 Protein-serine/threonine kinases Rhodoplastic [Chondrus crispus]|eukprot:XP_005717201.1 Protein-serine/threonine kinases Rhodoplastic [Chondrus crispus]
MQREPASSPASSGGTRTSSGSLRRGTPQNIQGWLYKEGKRFRSRYRRYLILRAGMLSSHRTENSPPTWQVRVADCPFMPGHRANELVIELPQRRISFFASNTNDFQLWLTALKSSRASGVDDFYRFGQLLGEGAFAQVKLAVDKEKGDKCAIKIIKKHGYDPSEMEYLVREMDIMKSVSHPHIVNTIDIFDSPSHLHIVLEYMQGGELFDIIADAGSFSEQQAAQVTRDVIKGIQYLHMHDIVHRDIKPENVLCVSKSWPLLVKLADFGLADFSKDGEIKSEQPSMIGTPGYVAPEVVNKEKYGTPVDMWAVGVLLYIMLSGKMPFYGRDDNACLRMISTGKYTMPPQEWSKISTDGKSLVRGLLQADPNKRLTANAALQHKWLEDPTALSSSPINNDLSGIHSSRRKFRKAVMATMTVGRINNLANLANATATSSSTVGTGSTNSQQNV